MEYMKFSPITVAVNHLLAQERPAADKLSAHAGKVLHLDAGLLQVRLRIAADGLLETAAEADIAAVTIHINFSDIPLILQNPERAFSHVRIDGDADLANTVSQVFRSLRWDAEDDLSRVVGDVVAVRLVSTGKAAFRAARSAGRKITENAAEYFLEENPMLLRTQPVTEFAGEVSRLRDDVERLAKRIERLKGGAA
jgi:ubiquinone biosynthesis protein UbiJ